MKKETIPQLTDEDKAKYDEYLRKLDNLSYLIPTTPIPLEVWDKIETTGEIPEEYSDRIGTIQVTDKVTGVTRLDYVEKDYYQFRIEEMKLEVEYRDVIVKVLNAILADQNTDTKMRQYATNRLKRLLADNKVNLPDIAASKLKNIDFPIDKVNRDIWGLLKYSTNGQITYAKYNVARNGSKQAIDILYSLDFSGLENDENITITRKLEPYDKRVYVAIAARFNAGYDMMTIQQIYNDMGYTGRAGASDIEKINAAITKMKIAQLYIDNLAEASNYKYDHFKYDGSLLPMERITAIINGQTAEAAIHVFREPPMVSFARKRKQLTTVEIKLFNSPLNKTNANIALEDYLIEEIARIKKGGRNSKMLYKTIYENANITTAKQKQRAPEKIKQLLDHYIKCKYIKAYKEKKDGITIEY